MSTVTASTLRVSVSEGIARVTLNRPPLNILDIETIRELNRAIRDLREDRGLLALVLAAEGRAFSAGVSVEDHLPGKADLMLRAFHEIFRQLHTLHCPLLAAVQGPAIGGGCELATFADIVVASEAATFGQPEIRLGVFPPVAAVRLAQRVGQARALRLILGGDVLSAREAERIGLVDRVVPPEELASAVEQETARLKDKSAAALRLAKRAVLAAAGRDFDAGLEAVERLFLEELMRTHDAAEGLRAFLGKRPPAWTHS
ncbi:MAG TPA: enoyl-CoA hydratase/isomerase family protein [Vicinamibacteria bacterium]|nr:enoyl-CoA hydratase/isomerase family protein [Vicinamibacteria bacterium]